MLAATITSHTEDALGRLLHQYRGAPLVTALLTGLLSGVQPLENAIYALDAGRQIANASGAQLDGLGELVGRKRGELGDPEYLLFLYGTITQNTSDSTIPRVFGNIASLFRASSLFIKTPNSPGANSSAGVSLGVGSPAISPNLYPAVKGILSNSVAAGVSVDEVTVFKAGGSFAMAGPQSWTAQAAPGFTPTALDPWPFGLGDVNNAFVGGCFATLI
jgi:hypothetical protein